MGSMEKTVYQGQYLRVSERVIGDDIYELAHVRPAVIIYARNDDGKFLFVREHRPHETPAVRLKPVTGFIDDGDDWLKTAQKELREEAGLVAKKFELYCHLPLTGSIVTDKYFILATGLSPDPQPLINPDGDVIEEIVYLDLADAISMTVNAQMPLTTDSLGLFLIKEKNL